MSTEESGSWYHCGHCGALFRSSLGYDEQRVCESCHRTPGTGVWPAVSVIQPVPAASKAAGFNKQAEKVVKIKKGDSSKRSRSKRIYWVMLVWLLILVSAAGLRYYFAESKTKLSDADSKSNSTILTVKEREKLLREALPSCDQTLRDFISATTVEEMGRLVFRDKDFAEQLERFNADNKLIRLDAETMVRMQQDYFLLGDEWMVWTQWRDASAENRFDAVFRNDGGVWKLDWPAFCRINPISWSGFIEGQGPDRSEFKLLARRMRENEIPRSDSDFIQILMVEPVWGKPDDVSQAPSIFMVDRISKEAQLLSAAFEVRKRDRFLYNATIAPMEPAEWVRLTVVISRDELDGKYRFNLDEIKACHWIDSSASGFDPDRLKMNKF